jgi:hypothetical protein
VRIKAYVSREQFIVDRCRGKRVLDCGVIGLTELDSDTRVAGVPTSLHASVAAVARESVGIDNASCTSEVAAQYPDLTIRQWDIEQPLDETPFDVVVLGDIIEHLSNPGLALDALRPLVEGELIVSCPNSLGGPNYLRFALGRFREGSDHVASHNKWTISNLLERHGFRVVETYTCLDRDRHAPSLGFRLVRRLLVRLPELGGTLLVVARRH